MNTTQEIKVVEQLVQMSEIHGFERVSFFVMFVVLVVLVIYVLRTSTKRESRLTLVIDASIANMNNLLLTHDQRSIDAIRTMQEASAYQRQEHKEMIDVLRSIHNKVEGVA